MQRVIYSLFLAAALVSCTGSERHYQDTSNLEQPPSLPQQSVENYAMDDTSRIEKRTSTTGLAERVYLLEGTRLQLRLKLPLEKAWYALAQAIKQGGIKIADYDRAKKVYYLAYGEASGGIFGFFQNDDKKPVYLVALKELGKETVIVASLAPEQGSASEDASNKLLHTLHDILHDELKPDFNGS